MNRPLWQRNLIGAAVAAAALGVMVAVDLRPSLMTYLDTVDPTVVVAARKTGTAEGQGWSIAQVKHLGKPPVAYGTKPPAGTVLTVVTVQRSGPVPANQSCGGVLTDGERRWRGQAPVYYSIPMAAGAGFNCTKPGPVQWAFLTPADAVPTAVDVVKPGGQILVRLQM